MKCVCKYFFYLNPLKESFDSSLAKKSVNKAKGSIFSTLYMIYLLMTILLNTYNKKTSFLKVKVRSRLTHWYLQKKIISSLSLNNFARPVWIWISERKSGILPVQTHSRIFIRELLFKHAPPKVTVYDCILKYNQRYVYMDRVDYNVRLSILL